MAFNVTFEFDEPKLKETIVEQWHNTTKDPKHPPNKDFGYKLQHMKDEYEILMAQVFNRTFSVGEPFVLTEDKKLIIKLEDMIFH